MILNREKEIDQKGNYVNKTNEFDTGRLRASAKDIEEHVNPNGTTSYVLRIGKHNVVEADIIAD